MDEQPPMDYVSAPAGGRGLSPATVIWIIGGIEVLLFGGCVGLMGVAASLPAEVFADQPRPAGVSLEDMKMALGVVAVLLGLLIVLPGVVLLFLGWAVRNGSAGAARAARWILMAQAAVVGLITLGNVVLGVSQGFILDVLFQAVVFGGFVALLLWGVRALRPAAAGGGVGVGGGRGGSADAAAEPWNEPWNDHLGR